MKQVHENSEVFKYSTILYGKVCRVRCADTTHCTSIALAASRNDLIYKGTAAALLAVVVGSWHSAAHYNRIFIRCK